MIKAITLRRITRIAYGDSLTAEDRHEGNFPVVGSGGISGTHARGNFQAPGIVIGRKGSYGTVHWVPTEGFAIDTAYYIDRTLTNVNLRWLYYALLSIDLRGPSQDVGVPGLSRDAAYASQLPMPPNPDEQRRIADFLDAETARIDRLALLRSRIFVKLTERENAFRDSLIEHLAKSEGYIPLRRLVTTIEQGSSPQCHSTPRQEESEWGVLKLSSVKRGVFFPCENKKLPEGESIAALKEVRPGDLLVTRANTPTLVGDATVVSEPCSRLLLPDLIYRVNLTTDTEPTFIAQVLLGNRVRSLIESIARGSSQSMVKLRGEDIKSIPIPNTSPSRQKHFAREMAENSAPIEELRSRLTRQVDLLAERRQALITAAVTGQFDVSTASGRGVTE